jgi:hypothetical protein
VGDVQVKAHGPLFDGRAEAEVARFLDEAKEMVAEAALKAVDRNLSESIRHPGSPPYYQAQINIAHQDRNPVVNDKGVIYGWWLEGIGSRNAPVTVFKGYHSFSKAEHEVDIAQDAIVGPALVRLVARLQ